MGKGSGTLRAGEWKAMSEGTWDKVQTCRRDKVPLLGKGKEEGRATIENSLHLSISACLQACRGRNIPGTVPCPTARNHLPPAMDCPPPQKYKYLRRTSFRTNQEGFSIRFPSLFSPPERSKNDTFIFLMNPEPSVPGIYILLSQ